VLGQPASGREARGKRRKHLRRRSRKHRGLIFRGRAGCFPASMLPPFLSAFLTPRCRISCGKSRERERESACSWCAERPPRVVPSRVNSSHVNSYAFDWSMRAIAPVIGTTAGRRGGGWGDGEGGIRKRQMRNESETHSDDDRNGSKRGWSSRKTAKTDILSLPFHAVFLCARQASTRLRAADVPHDFPSLKTQAYADKKDRVSERNCGDSAIVTARPSGGRT